MSYRESDLPVRYVRKRIEPPTVSWPRSTPEFKVVVPIHVRGTHRQPWEGPGEPHDRVVEILECGHWLYPEPDQERVMRRCEECRAVRAQILGALASATLDGAETHHRFGEDGLIEVDWRWPGGARHSLYAYPYGHAQAPSTWTPWTAKQFANRLAGALAVTRHGGDGPELDGPFFAELRP